MPECYRHLTASTFLTLPMLSFSLKSLYFLLDCNEANTENEVSLRRTHLFKSLNITSPPNGRVIFNVSTAFFQRNQNTRLRIGVNSCCVEYFGVCYQLLLHPCRVHLPKGRWVVKTYNLTYITHRPVSFVGCGDFHRSDPKVSGKSFQ
jgi:hypothetical protein